MAARVLTGAQLYAQFWMMMISTFEIILGSSTTSHSVSLAAHKIVQGVNSTMNSEIWPVATHKKLFSVMAPCSVEFLACEM